MKLIMLILGAILILVAVVSLTAHVSNFNELSEYQKGELLGFAIMFVLGLVLCFFGYPKKKAQN